MAVHDSGDRAAAVFPQEKPGTAEEKRTRLILLQSASPDRIGGERLLRVLAKPRNVFRLFAARILPRILRPMYAPEDIVQECYLSVLEHPRRMTFRGELGLVAWFKGVIRMKVKGLCQRELAKKRMAPSPDSGRGHVLIIDGMAGTPSTARTAEDDFLDGEKFQRVLNVLRDVPPQACLLVIHRCFEGLSLGEAAGRVGLDPAAASRLLHETKRLVQKRWTGLERREERGGPGGSLDPPS